MATNLRERYAHCEYSEVIGHAMNRNEDAGNNKYASPHTRLFVTKETKSRRGKRSLKGKKQKETQLENKAKKSPRIASRQLFFGNKADEAIQPTKDGSQPATINTSIPTDQMKPFS